MLAHGLLKYFSKVSPSATRPFTLNYGKRDLNSHSSAPRADILPLYNSHDNPTRLKLSTLIIFGVEGIEPAPTVPKTAALPLSYTPLIRNNNARGVLKN